MLSVASLHTCQFDDFAWQTVQIWLENPRRHPFQIHNKFMQWKSQKRKRKSSDRNLKSMLFTKGFILNLPKKNKWWSTTLCDVFLVFFSFKWLLFHLNRTGTCFKTFRYIGATIVQRTVVWILKIVAITSGQKILKIGQKAHFLQWPSTKLMQFSCGQPVNNARSRLH